MTPCTTCKGSCPAPAACELPIQPSEAEITRNRIEAWKYRAAYAVLIAGGACLAASAAFAIGRIGG